MSEDLQQESRFEETSDGWHVICPYCEYQHGDAWEFCGPDERSMTCHGCYKDFTHWASITYHASPSRRI